RRSRLDTAEASRLIRMRGTGEPLAPTIKHRLEATLGVDVNGVRVHADGTAQAASRALRAKAFTHRNHIFLGAGQSQHDLGLMAHEATHALQQDAIARRKPAEEHASAGGPSAAAPPSPAAAGTPARGGAHEAPPREAAAPARTPPAPGAPAAGAPPSASSAASPAAPAPLTPPAAAAPSPALTARASAAPPPPDKP